MLRSQPKTSVPSRISLSFDWKLFLSCCADILQHLHKDQDVVRLSCYCIFLKMSNFFKFRALFQNPKGLPKCLTRFSIQYTHTVWRLKKTQQITQQERGGVLARIEKLQWIVMNVPWQGGQGCGCNYSKNDISDLILTRRYLVAAYWVHIDVDTYTTYELN